MWENPGEATRQKRACLGKKTKDKNFHPSTGWKMKPQNYLKGEKVWFTSQFHSFLELCLWEFYLEACGLLPPFMEYASFWYPRNSRWAVHWLGIKRILNTILFSNPWMGVLAFQLMSAIPVPTDLRIDVIKAPLFLLSLTHLCYDVASRVVTAYEGAGLGPWSSTTPLSEAAWVTVLLSPKVLLWGRKEVTGAKTFTHANDPDKGAKFPTAGADPAESRMFCKVFCEHLSMLTAVERTCLSCSLNWVV